MINNITYYKMKSPYEGDITKNCALTGVEVDNNFFTLEGRDIKSISVEDSDIVITLLNGNCIKAKNALDNVITNISFDENSGILSVFYHDGRIEKLKGFNSSMNPMSKISVNETMEGNGSASKPIGISPLYKTGQYKPVDGIMETMSIHNDSCGCHHKEIKNPKPGERYLVKEKIGAYGFLYNFKDATQIACELKKINSKWRIPTKEDWDDMLNAVEPCECDRDHSKSTPNKYLGKWAGKMLKSKHYWKKGGCCDNNCEPFSPEYIDNSCECNNVDPCRPTYCGEEMNLNHHKPTDTSGIDKYGFGVLPAGYADDAGNILFFGERASFWTSTNMHFTNIYEKRFEYNKNNVYQDVIPGQNFLSIRLVKDYDGENFVEAEEILGQTYPTVLMPSTSKGKAIWTAVNISVSGKNFRELIPNYGQDMTFVTKYFIDEWNGHKWMRNEFKEGDSVVVKTDTNGKIDAEYRLVNGKLKEVSELIYDSVIDAINPKFEELGEKLTNEINRSKTKDKDLEDKLDELFEKSSNAELNIEKLQQDIKDVNERVDNTNEKVENINKTLTDFGQETKKAFDIINDVLKTSFDNINNAIAKETEERVNADNDLKEKIDNIKSDNDKSFEEINKSLEDEKNERVKKDEEIENKLLIQEGSQFDSSNGILTLKSQNGENDIQVQFVLNMGKF